MTEYTILLIVVVNRKNAVEGKSILENIQKRIGNSTKKAMHNFDKMPNVKLEYRCFIYCLHGLASEKHIFLRRPDSGEAGICLNMIS